VVRPLAETAVRLCPTFSAQGASNSLWSIATLGVADDAIVCPLVEAAAALSPTFRAQEAANCFWAVATLGVEDAALVRPLALAVARLAPHFESQGAAFSLWAAASLGVREEGLVRPLAEAVERHAGAMDAHEASSVLQAHWGGLPQGEGVVAACWRAWREDPPAPPTTSNLQRAVAATFAALGYEVAEEVPILGGLRHVDIVATPPGGGERIAVEVDGVFHYFQPLPPLPPAEAAASLAAPPPPPPAAEGERKLKPAALRRAHIEAEGFKVLVVVPYYEWERAVSEEQKKACVTRLVAEATQRAANAPWIEDKAGAPDGAEAGRASAGAAAAGTRPMEDGAGSGSGEGGGLAPAAAAPPPPSSPPAGGA
jgi:hypothetical protein